MQVLGMMKGDPKGTGEEYLLRCFRGSHCFLASALSDSSCLISLSLSFLTNSCKVVPLDRHLVWFVLLFQGCPFSCTAWSSWGSKPRGKSILWQSSCKVNAQNLSPLLPARFLLEKFSCKVKKHLVFTFLSKCIHALESFCFALEIALLHKQVLDTQIWSATDQFFCLAKLVIWKLFCLTNSSVNHY